MKHNVSFDLEFKKNSYPGKFIVLEGIDGSGKTTQIQILEEALKKKNIPMFLTKNPTDHPIGKMIREVLSGAQKIPATARQYLFCADRVVQEEEIIAHLKEGGTVISDRYFWSSVAYGMADKDVKDERLLTAYSILSFYNEFILPDLTIFLDVDVDTAVSRFSTKEKLEIYENKKFITKVKDNYDFLLKKFPEEFTVLDSRKDLETVSREIIKKVEEIL
jgi:dTMP kinase